jgi:hypothetical protein
MVAQPPKEFTTLCTEHFVSVLIPLTFLHLSSLKANLFFLTMHSRRFIYRMSFVTTRLLMQCADALFYCFVLFPQYVGFILYLDYSVQNATKMCTVRTVMALVPRTGIAQIRFTHDCEERKSYTFRALNPNPSIRILRHRLVHSFKTVLSLSLSLSLSQFEELLCCCLLWKFVEQIQYYLWGIILRANLQLDVLGNSIVCCVAMVTGYSSGTQNEIKGDTAGEFINNYITILLLRSFIVAKISMIYILHKRVRKANYSLLLLYSILHLSSSTWHSLNDRAITICSMINTLL